MKTEKIQPVLIDHNTKQADSRINEAQQTAIRLTALIRSYNDLPVLCELRTASDMNAFLTDPIKYLDQSVLRDTGFESKVQPSPAGIAQLYSIPYQEIVKKIQNARINTNELLLFRLDESNEQLILRPDAEAAIRENSKIWLTDPAQISDYNDMLTLCELLNSHCKKYHVIAPSMNACVPHLFLRCDPIENAWQFRPNVDLIKKTNNIK